MTVSNTNKKNTYTGDGATDTFAFTFKVIKSTDVLVKIKDTNGTLTTKTESTHYDVTGTLPGTGNVVFTTGNIPSATDTVILVRDMDFLQETDLVEKDAFPADTVEQQLDQLTMQDLQLKEISDRTVLLDDGVDTDSVSATLPTPAANKFLAWNDDATALEGVDYTAVGLGSLLDDPSPQVAADLDMNSYDLIFEDNTGIKDDQDNELLWFQNLGTNTAVNHLEIINAATGGNPTLSAVGDDANVGMELAAKGTGAYIFKGSSDTAAEIRLSEDTDNGTNYMGLKAPAAVTSDTTLTLPDGPGTAGQILEDTDGAGTLGWGDKYATKQVVQIVNTTTSTVASTTSNIPIDDTIPQSGEGAAIAAIDTTITPKNSSNKLIIDISGYTAGTGSGVIGIIALFQDSTADALCAWQVSGSGDENTFTARYVMTAGTTSATTFKLRYGATPSDTIYWLQNATNDFSTAQQGGITITEVAA